MGPSSTATESSAGQDLSVRPGQRAGAFPPHAAASHRASSRGRYSHCILFERPLPGVRRLQDLTTRKRKAPEAFGKITTVLRRSSVCTMPECSCQRTAGVLIKAGELIFRIFWLCGPFSLTPSRSRCGSKKQPQTKRKGLSTAVFQ